MYEELKSDFFALQETISKFQDCDRSSCGFKIIFLLDFLFFSSLKILIECSFFSLIFWIANWKRVTKTGVCQWRCGTGIWPAGMTSWDPSPLGSQSCRNKGWMDGKETVSGCRRGQRSEEVLGIWTELSKKKRRRRSMLTANGCCCGKCESGC